MLVKNNYNECLTNLACSIRKYFNLEYQHNTLEYIDELLEKYQPKNVVMILCDGMGSNIMNNVLDKESFLVKHQYKTITTVFPATTVAATTTITTGLNPCETGMLGWHMYFKDIDKIITTFRGSVKGDTTDTPLEEAINYRNKHMITKTIMEEINEKGEYQGYTLFPFGDHPYKNINDMYHIIETKCREDGRKFIYAYDTEPDHTMHLEGSKSDKVQRIIKNTNKKIKELSKKVKDTIIIVIADHGHKNSINLLLDDYPLLKECLERDISLEPRAVNFHIKKEKEEEFLKLFKDYFGKDFDLYPKTEIINDKLFGDGQENPVFRDILGDYLAIAKTDKAIISDKEMLVAVSHHAGYTDDEIYVPLIIINTKENK